jgi:hypothetical protein
LAIFVRLFVFQAVGLQHQQGEEYNAVKEVGISPDRISLETRKAGVL